MRNVVYRAKRIDNGELVYGRYFITPLTDINSGLDAEFGLFFLSDTIQRHCISDKDGGTYVIDETTLGIKGED